MRTKRAHGKSGICGVYRCHGQLCQGGRKSTDVPSIEIEKPREEFSTGLFREIQEALARPSVTAQKMASEENVDLMTMSQEDAEELIHNAFDDIDFERLTNDGKIDFDEDKQKEVITKMKLGISSLIYTTLLRKLTEHEILGKVGQAEFAEHQVDESEFFRNEAYAKRALELRLPISADLLVKASYKRELRALALSHPKYKHIQVQSNELKTQTQNINSVSLEVFKEIKEALQEGFELKGDMIIAHIKDITKSRFNEVLLKKSVDGRLETMSETKQKVAGIFGVRKGTQH